MWIYILALSVVEIGVVLNFFDAGNDFVQFGDGRHLFCVSLIQMFCLWPLFTFLLLMMLCCWVKWNEEIDVKTEMSTIPPIFLEKRDQTINPKVNKKETTKHNLATSNQTERSIAVAPNHEQEGNDHHVDLIHGGFTTVAATTKRGTGRLLHLFGWIAIGSHEINAFHLLWQNMLPRVSRECKEK